MKVFSSFRLLVSGVILLSSCLAEAQVRQTRQLSEFQTVQSSGGIDVVLTQGSTTSVVVEAAQDAQAHIITQVQGGALKIGWENGYSWKNLLSNKRSVNVYVTCPRLAGVSVSGGADASGKSTFTADDFTISASGGSDVTLALTAKSLTSKSSGGGDVSVTGRVDHQTVDVSGGSDYHAFGLRSTTADVNASGGSDINILVDGELTCRVSGGSDVRYKGTARVANSSASGGSGVHHVN